MIKMPRSSVALNESSLPAARCRVWRYRDCVSSDSPAAMLRWVASISDSAPDGHVQALILNCDPIAKDADGKYGNGCGLDLGSGIRMADVGHFGIIKPYVDTIWILCGMAFQTGEPGGDGSALCSKIARAADAYVITACSPQPRLKFLPANHIDNFEGLVVRYNRHGRIDWQHRYDNSFFKTMGEAYGAAFAAMME